MQETVSIPNSKNMEIIAYVLRRYDFDILLGMARRIDCRLNFKQTEKFLHGDDFDIVKDVFWSEVDTVGKYGTLLYVLELDYFYYRLIDYTQARKDYLLGRIEKEKFHDMTNSSLPVGYVMGEIERRREIFKRMLEVICE